MNVRNYKLSDYRSIEALYKMGDFYGGQYDENRDSEQRLADRIKSDPEAILVCEDKEEIIGTVSIIEDGRVAWLFRFSVPSDLRGNEAAKLLYDRAIEILKARGHRQVLVYSPLGNQALNKRYQQLLSFNKGNDYTCFWKDL